MSPRRLLALAAVAVVAFAAGAALVDRPPTEPSPAPAPRPAPPAPPPQFDVAALEGNDVDAEQQWGQWRGPLATGVAPHATPPLRWSETQRVRWKVALSGHGLASPVVWGKHVFVLTAIPFGAPVPPEQRREGEHDNRTTVQQQRFSAMALRRSDGAVVWQRTLATAAPHEGGHATGSYASASPATDGEVLVAHFGSAGTFALDLAGRVIWSADLGDMQTKHGHGEGSSPVIHGETVIINWDHQGDSFLVALDRKTGEERWRTPRESLTSWSTPLVVEHDGRALVIVSEKTVRAYDLQTGVQVWQCGSLTKNVCATPVAADGMVFAGGSYSVQSLLAIRLDGEPRVAWRTDRHTPYVPSPVLALGTLYYLHHLSSRLTAVEAATGRPHYEVLRLPIRQVYASLVCADDRIYVVGRRGTTCVVACGPRPKILAVNELDDRFDASPAIAGRELYLRGRRFLYCIAGD